MRKLLILKRENVKVQGKLILMNVETIKLNLTDANSISHNRHDAIVLQFLESVFEVLACDELSSGNSIKIFLHTYNSIQLTICELSLTSLKNFW